MVVTKKIPVHVRVARNIQAARHAPAKGVGGLRALLLGGLVRAGTICTQGTNAVLIPRRAGEIQPCTAVPVALAVPVCHATTASAESTSGTINGLASHTIVHEGLISRAQLRQVVVRRTVTRHMAWDAAAQNHV